MSNTQKGTKIISDWQRDFSSVSYVHNLLLYRMY